MIEQQVTPLRLDTEEKEQRDRLETDFHASQNTVTIYPKILWCITDRAQVAIVDYHLNLTNLAVSPCHSAAVLAKLVCDSTLSSQDRSLGPRWCRYVHIAHHAQQG